MADKLRVEILLPLTYNTGADVEPEKFFNIKDRIIKKFGGISTDETTIDGFWVDPSDGKAYHDRCKKLIIDMDECVENREWFSKYKEELKAELKQKEIYIIISKIEQL